MYVDVEAPLPLPSTGTGDPLAFLSLLYHLGDRVAIADPPALAVPFPPPPVLGPPPVPPLLRIKLVRTGAPPASHHLGDGIARADISVDVQETISCSSSPLPPSSLPLVVRDLGLGGGRWGGDVRGPTVDMEIAAVWWARGKRVQGSGYRV